MRDHFSRCERRGNEPIPHSLERGRKRHACDECSRLKVKCDNNIPCRKCKEFGRTCVKTRQPSTSKHRPRVKSCALTDAVPSGSSSDTTPPEYGADTPPYGPTPRETPQGSPRSGMSPESVNAGDRNSIGFLLNGAGESDFSRDFPKSLTLSPMTSIRDLIPINKPFDASQPVLTRPNYDQELLTPVSQHNRRMSSDTSLDIFLSSLEFSTFERQTQNYQLPNEDVLPWSGYNVAFADKPVLEQRAFDVREKLRYETAMFSPGVASNEVLDAIDILTADNIAKWTQLYFRHWHKSYPIVHEPSYHPCSAALPLLLSMACIGGMVSGST